MNSWMRDSEAFQFNTADIHAQNAFEPWQVIYSLGKSPNTVTYCNRCLCVLFGAPQALSLLLCFNLISTLPILKGSSLFFLQAAVVTSFSCDRLLSALLRSTGLNDRHTMLHCPQTCDVGAQERHRGGPVCTFQAQVSISVIPSQIFFIPAH